MCQSSPSSVDDAGVHEVERIDREQHVGLVEAHVDGVLVDDGDAREIRGIAVLHVLDADDGAQVADVETALVAGDQQRLEGVLDVLGAEIPPGVELDALAQEDAPAELVVVGLPPLGERRDDVAVLVDAGEALVDVADDIGGDELREGDGIDHRRIGDDVGAQRLGLGREAHPCRERCGGHEAPRHTRSSCHFSSPRSAKSLRPDRPWCHATTGRKDHRHRIPWSCGLARRPLVARTTHSMSPDGQPQHGARTAANPMSIRVVRLRPEARCAEESRRAERRWPRLP